MDHLRILHRLDHLGEHLANDGVGVHLRRHHQHPLGSKLLNIHDQGFGKGQVFAHIVALAAQRVEGAGGFSGLQAVLNRLQRQARAIFAAGGLGGHLLAQHRHLLHFWPHRHGIAALAVISRARRNRHQPERLQAVFHAEHLDLFWLGT